MVMVVEVVSQPQHCLYVSYDDLRLTGSHRRERLLRLGMYLLCVWRKKRYVVVVVLVLVVGEPPRSL